VLIDFALFTHKKEKKIFLIYKEIQSGAVAKSYMCKNGMCDESGCNVVSE
jgi:hypothetical protein